MVVDEPMRLALKGHSRERILFYLVKQALRRIRAIDGDKD
jgi:hypothetical protein